MSDKSKNVIVFFTDQQRWDSSAIYGNPLDLTPNFDNAAMAPHSSSLSPPLRLPSLRSLSLPLLFPSLYLSLCLPFSPFSPFPSVSVSLSLSFPSPM